MSNANKEKCFSAIVTVTFDPSIVYLDMTNNSYIHRIPNSQTTVDVNGYSYVNSYKFKIDATSSEKVIFYKANPSENYTYPLVNTTSVIDVDEELA